MRVSVGHGDPQGGQHVLLDGHIRLIALRELNIVEVQCLVASEQTYGQEVLNLVLAEGYLTKLMETKLVARFLRQKQPEVLAEYEVVVQTVYLDQ